MAFKLTHAKTLPEHDLPGGHYHHFGIPAHWNERVVTAVAVSVAVLIVATVAYLMGMA